MQTEVPSSALKIGMFVSSLDRPWLDTPFMLQGFLIENDEDIRLLQKYCECVHVDWSRSTLQQPAASLNRQDQLIRDASANEQPLSNTSQSAVAGTKTRPVSKNNDVSGRSDVLDTFATRPSQKTQARISPPQAAPTVSQLGKLNVPDNSDQEGFLSGFAGKMMGLFKSKSTAPQASVNFTQQRPALEDNVVNNERPAFIPRDILLSTYVDASPVEEEIAPAVKAHTHANDVLNKVVQDIKANKRFAIEETEVVIQEVVDSMVRNPDAMMWITRLRKQDELVYGQGLQVAVYLVALGRHLGLPKPFLDHLCMTGLLLDIGKIKVPKELLLKKGRLTSEEFETVKSHVLLSLDILKETPNIHPDVLEGIAQHHERENGSGYPAGLSGGEVSLFGRMSAIVDSFSALTNPRSYAEIMPAYEALQCLINFNPGLYQATMIEQFIQAIGVFPVGSMVQLSTGEVAVVISHSKVRRLKPRVLIISDSSKRPLPKPITLDLLSQPHATDENQIYIQRGLPTGAFDLDAREYFLA